MSAVDSPATESTAFMERALFHPSPRWPLPVELLLHCLMAADLVTRVRSSHVCQTWREAALNERRLWDSFACSCFHDKQHENAMLALLEAMLLRSRPLPFHLTVPHLDGRSHIYDVDRILGLKVLDVFRLAAYHGPARIFKWMTPSCAPLPNLLCLDVLRCPFDGDPDIVTIDLTVQVDARCLPNLRQLAAPNIRFLTDGAPFGSLQSITCGWMEEPDYRALFTHCPRLVRLDIRDCAMSAPLPDLPVPSTLEEFSLRCTCPIALDVLALMRHWRGVRVPRFTFGHVYSLQGVLPLFLASHAQAIEMRLPGGTYEVILAAGSEDDCVWTLLIAAPWAADFLASIENPTSDRLTSISVDIARFGALLRAQLHTPRLKKLELRLDITARADGPLLQTGGELFIRAPGLHTMVFNLADGCSDSLEDALGVLRLSFRALILYDAELLDAVVVSREAERLCAGFKPLATDYIVIPGGYPPPMDSPS